jgi:hypothetical protein
MATQEYAASIQGVGIRVTRLDAAGNLLTGPGDSYVTSAFMRLSFTPEYEDGDEITEKNANGIVCVTYKSPDVLKRITMELAICEPDPELTNLVSGGLLLRKNLGTFASANNQSIGWSSPAVGDDPAGFGVAIECWSNAIKDGKKSSTLPYFHWVFPYAKLRQSGDRVIENGMLASTFEGYGLGNANFGSAPDGRWEFPVAAQRPYSYARATWAPVGLQGFYTWNYAGEGATENTSYNAVTNLDGVSVKVVTAALTSNVVTLTSSTAHGFTVGQSLSVSGVDTQFGVTNKALATNVATLTTSAAHGYIVGDTVSVIGVDSTFNTASAAITAVTSTTLSYAVTATDVTSVASTGGIVERSLFDGTYTIATVPSTTTLTYAKTHANVASYSVAVGAVESADSTSGWTSGFNVPGNAYYNADLPIDRVIRSNEDPTA